MDADKDVCSALPPRGLHLGLILRLPGSNIMIIRFIFWAQPGVQCVCGMEPKPGIAGYTLVDANVAGCSSDTFKHLSPILVNLYDQLLCLALRCVFLIHTECNVCS